jgi:hypothetical protein
MRLKQKYNKLNQLDLAQKHSTTISILIPELDRK